MIKVALLGPQLSAVSGVSTHLNQIFSSSLFKICNFKHFQVGGEGRSESVFDKVWRLFSGPVFFFLFLLRHRPDIVQLNTSLEPKSFWRDLLFLCLAKLLRRRVVYQVHGGALPQDFFSGHPLLTKLLRWVLCWPDVVVLLAQSELEAYQRFVTKQRLVVIPNAIETDALVQRPLDKVNQAQLHLVYVGRLAESKGVFEALEALSLLIKTGHDLRLTLAGGGPDEARFKERVSSLALVNSVTFAGPLFGKAKDDLWCGSDIFVFPTYHREGLPYALLEAMAAGAVPVTTRVGAIPDVMVDGVHGRFVPTQNVQSLVQVLTDLDSDRTLLLSMARAGRQRVLQQYSVARMVADFEQLYKSIRGGASCAASQVI